MGKEKALYPSYQNYVACCAGFDRKPKYNPRANARGYNMPAFARPVFRLEQIVKR